MLGSSSTIYNNIIINNFATNGGGIHCIGSSLSIINSTISRNSASWGGGIFSDASSHIIVANTILWEDTEYCGPEEIYSNCSTTVAIYSNIQGGWPGEGNMDADPLFDDPDNGNFRLLVGSPCIDAGNPNSPFDPDSTRADIGAFYFDQSTSIEETYPLPLQFSLSQNYPNPFNPTTTISFMLTHPQHATLKIYDLLGREIHTLIDEHRQAGQYTAVFDASDLVSGFYFYCLQVDDYTESKSMILLK
ncbi:MAG: T9SS type A sorting domain-containing protein [candidate division Zixibacteria bacterium]|nr:T9SS type A sorting domain-containing protein [candidate division Zixibacteria bacterium]